MPVTSQLSCESLGASAGISHSADDIPKRKVASVFRPPSPDVLAYLDFSVSTTGILAGVKVGALTAALARGRGGAGCGCPQAPPHRSLPGGCP